MTSDQTRAADPGAKPDDQNPAAVDTTRAGSSSHSPKTPHERDVGAGMTDGKPDPVMEQGAKDLKRGVQDTSRGKESDAAYQKQR